MAQSEEWVRRELEALRERCSALEEKVGELERGNVLWGKKWYAAGDSYTEGDFTGWTDEEGRSGKDSPVLYDSERQMYKTYPWWIARRNHMTVINDGFCGSTMPLSRQCLTDPEHYDVNYGHPFALKRYRRIPKDVDYITLWFGINDSANTYLGERDDETNETFYGAWNLVLSYLLTNYPCAKIGIIISEDGTYTYRQAMREAARRWGIPYLDMMGDAGVPPIFGREEALGYSKRADSLRRSTFQVSEKNTHPNLKAHEYQSTFIENFLRSL